MSEYPPTSRFPDDPAPTFRMPEAMPAPPGVGGYGPGAGASPGGFYVPGLSEGPGGPGFEYGVGGQANAQMGPGGFGGPTPQVGNTGASCPPPPSCPPAQSFAPPTSKPPASKPAPVTKPASSTPNRSSQTANKAKPVPKPQPPISSSRPPNADYLHKAAQETRAKPRPQEVHDSGCCIIC